MGEMKLEPAGLSRQKNMTVLVPAPPRIGVEAERLAARRRALEVGEREANEQRFQKVRRPRLCLGDQVAIGRIEVHLGIHRLAVPPAGRDRRPVANLQRVDGEAEIGIGR